MSGTPHAGVIVRGSGLAAAALSHILADAGLAVSTAPRVAPAAVAAPVVMLGEQAVALLHDVFRRPLFATAHRIERRTVRWGDAPDPVTVPHRALAISGADIAAAVPPPVAGNPAGQHAFVVYAEPPFPDDTVLHFGSRPAAAAPVVLAGAADQAAAVVEATQDGWLFLIPQGQGQGWLLAVGGEPDALLAKAPLVSRLVAALSPVAARFETAPRILGTLAGPGWLAIGHHALAFDPICGDGTATAARAAILAGAVIAGIADGNCDAEADALLAHHAAMLVAAMRRHLQVSLPFYRSGGASAWWQAQADALADGHAWCTRFLAQAGEPRFVLQGNRLIARELAA